MTDHDCPHAVTLRNLLDACERGRPLADITDRLRVEVGRLAGEGTTQPDAAEPTATQLYDAVKAKRYDRNAENPILTIPEIHAVLAARAEWLADRASGEGTAPPPDLVQVGWLRTDGAPTGRGPFYVLDDDPDCHAQDVADERLVPVYRLADRGTAPQVPAEVLWEGETVDGAGLDGDQSYIPNSAPPITADLTSLEAIQLREDDYLAGAVPGYQRRFRVAADGAPPEDGDRG